MTSAARLFSADRKIRSLSSIADAAEADIFGGEHVVAHIVLKDYPYFAAQIFYGIFAQIAAIEENLPAVGS